MPSPSGPTRETNSKVSPQPVRVLLLNESRISCQSLRDSLERCSRKTRVVGCAANLVEAENALRSGGVDVALINDDIQDGPQTFRQILRAIHHEFPQTKLIALLKRADSASVVDAFRNGARGVFHRSQTAEALCKCVRAIHDGQIWANSHDLQYVVEALYDSPAAVVMDPGEIALLTKRENEAARLVSEGHSNREIAGKLGLTEHTVSNYLFRIYNKLGISSRVELVLYAFNQKREM